VLTLDKRRHDPQAPHRYGATAVYDLALDRRVAAEMAAASDASGSITIDANDNN
jgi:NitT/TauT family transport system ATP-binding protein